MSNVIAWLLGIAVALLLFPDVRTWQGIALFSLGWAVGGAIIWIVRTTWQRYREG